MDRSLCKLTLVGPPHASQQIIELLLTHDPPVKGFTTWSAEGHGQGFANASLREKVRGHVEREIIVAVMKRTTADSILETISKTIAVPHLTFWIEPVERFGHMQVATGVTSEFQPT